MRRNYRSYNSLTQWLPASLLVALFFGLAALFVQPGSAVAQGCSSTATVLNTSDSGPDSLRQAIADVCAGGTIDFDPGLTASGPATITLTSGELGITKNMTIDGPGADLLAVSGNDAVRVFNVSSGANVTIAGLTVRDGSGGSEGNGGGILNAGTLMVMNSALLDNSVSGSNRGGGLYNNGASGQVTLADSIIAGNRASERGGGVFTTGAGLVSISNTTFYSNTGSMGGALSASYGYAAVTNSTFAGNSATAGAAIRTSMGAITLTNTIVEGSLSGGNCSLSPWTDNGGNVSDDNTCGFNTANGSLGDTDPLLGELTLSNHTYVLPLLPGSPAIDAGVMNGCPSKDQRGAFRPDGASCDSGAFETQGFQVALTGGTPQTTSIYSAFAQPLQVTVSSMYADPVGPGGVVTFTPPVEGPGLNVTIPFTAVTDANGVASSDVITAGAIAGSYSVTPTVRGEGFSPAVFNGAPPPAVFALINTRIAPNISLSSSPNPSVYGEMVVLSANVATDVFGANTPTGIVTFTVDGDFWSAETLNAWGEAWFYNSSLPVGSHSVVAEYGGDAGYTPGQSDPVTQVVNKAPTETALEIKPNHAFYGEKVSFDVAVNSDIPQPNALVQRAGPSGALIITDTTGVIDLDGWVVDGEAAVSGGSIPAGTYNVVATFVGNDNYASSTSQPATLVVEKHATTTSLTSSSNPVFVNAPLCFTAAVGEMQLGFVRSLGLAAPTGAVVITDAGGALNLGGSLVNGSVELCAPPLAAGTYTVTATYLGDERYATSVATQLIQVVERHATGTMLALAPSQVYVGDTFQLQATVSNIDPLALINGGPSGEVEFLVDGDPLGSGTLVSGQASLSVPAPIAGAFQLTARYLGNNVYAPSSSAAAQLTVVKRPTMTTLTAASNPSKQRDAVLFTANVLPQLADGFAAEALLPKPTGAVIFAAGGAEFGRARLVEGVATLDYALLPVGNVTITAEYVGSDMYNGSQSAAHQQTVLPMPLAVNDAAGVQEQAIRIDVTANDQDPAGGGLTVISVSAPAHGAATVEPDSRSVIYTPAAGYSGVDTFTYVIRDANGNQDEALVVVINTRSVEGMGKPQVQPVDPSIESTGAFTTSAATVSVQAPAGFYTPTLAEKDVLFISFTPVITPSAQTNTPPAGLKFGNLEYTLAVYRNDQLLTGQAFAVPLAVTISYDPAVLRNLKPATLGLWYWNGAAWSTDGITLINHDVVNHTITVSMTHFSQYAFFAAAPTDLEPDEEPEAAFRVYLPAINNQ